MGCLSANVTKITDSPSVEITKDSVCNVAITSIIDTFAAAVTFVHSLVVSIIHQNSGLQVEVSTDDTERINVEVGLICTISISDDIELWWCDDWKMYWSNKNKTLWREE